MFKKVGVFIVLKFRTCKYKSASSVGLWLMIKGSSVGILRFRNCWRRCSVAVPSVFSSIFRDWFPWRTLAVVQILHYIHVDRFLFKSVKWLVDWDCLQNFFLYECTGLTYATNTKLDKFICSKRVFENLYTCTICCFYKTYELRKLFYAFTWYPWLLFSITCFGRHVISRLSGGED